MPRLAQGDLINPTGRRTPLSQAYDGLADQMVRAAIQASGAWITRLVQSPAGAATDKGGLTEHERALQQALYYHRRIYRHGDPYYVYDGAGRRFENPNPDRTHALQVRWGARVTVRDLFGRPQYERRNVQLRVHAIGEASLYAAERYG